MSGCGQSSPGANNASNQGQVEHRGLDADELLLSWIGRELSVCISSQMRTNVGIHKGWLCSDILTSALCRAGGKTTSKQPTTLFCFILPNCILFFSEQSWPQPAACEEMGLLPGGSTERPRRTRPVPEVPGVRVQLREPAVSQNSVINRSIETQLVVCPALYIHFFTILCCSLMLSTVFTFNVLYNSQSASTLIKLCWKYNICMLIGRFFTWYDAV